MRRRVGKKSFFLIFLEKEKIYIFGRMGSYLVADWSIYTGHVTHE